MKDFLKINPADNVAVAINPLAKGTVVNVDGTGDITLVSDIPAGLILRKSFIRVSYSTISFTVSSIPLAWILSRYSTTRSVT